jgi:hypothetical protein
MRWVYLAAPGTAAIGVFGTFARGASRLLRLGGAGHRGRSRAAM